MVHLGILKELSPVFGMMTEVLETRWGDTLSCDKIGKKLTQNRAITLGASPNALLEV